MRRLCQVVLVLLASTYAIDSAAQKTSDYPSKPIRLIVPFTPGGGSDVIARLLAQKMAESMGQPIVIDNKPGAGGSIGTMAVAQSAPDGYTLLLGTSSTHGINPWLYSKLGYDVVKDFEPISILATTDYALAVPADSPAKSVKDLISENDPNDPLHYASSGNGTTSHLAAAYLANAADTKFAHVPYKGGAPAVQDLLGGRVAFMFDNTLVFIPHAQSGKVRILATTGKTRSAALKDVPTMMEAGIKDYEVIGWWALFAPAKTPQPIIDRLHNEVVKAIALPEVQKRLKAMGNEPYATTPAETKAFIDSELEKFKVLVQAAGAKLD